MPTQIYDDVVNIANLGTTNLSSLIGGTTQTAGLVLTGNGNGTLPTMQAVAAGAMTKISTVTASGSATVDFSNLLTSTYDNYMITAENVVPATTNTYLQMRFGTGATPTWSSSGYIGTTYGSGPGFTVTDPASASTQLDLGLNASYGQLNTSTDVGSWWILVNNVNNASNYKNVFSNGTYNYQGAGTSMVIAVCGGQWQTATVVSSIRFLYSTGNIATGVFKLYGIQN
jgi:hypothetical protein